MDIPTVMDYVQDEELYREQSNYIKKTQFRSYEFAPRSAKWVWKGVEIPATKHSIDDIESIPNCVWWVDNFGNCKTTLLPEDIDFKPGKSVYVEGVGEVKCYERLKDVPNDEPALIIGSSGILDKRFLELVVQGKHAGKKYEINPGFILDIKQ